MVKNDVRAQYLSEGFVTAFVVTLVRLLACMDPQVLLQRGILGERLATAFGRTRRVRH